MASPSALGSAFRLLNAIDAVFTLYIVGVLHGVELNPAMGWLISLSPMLFLFVKVLAGGLVAAYCEHHAERGSALARFALWYGCALFTLISAAHAAVIFGG